MSTNTPKITRLLVIQLKEGNKKAFRSLFNRYYKILCCYVLQYTKSEHMTEEVVQEVFVKVWISRKSLNIHKDFSSFLFVMARNKVYDHLRKLSSRNALKQTHGLQIHKTTQNSFNELQYREYEHVLGAALNKLSEKQRTIYTLSRQHGKNNKEIADQLGLSPKTVKNYLWEALKTIKIHLQMEGLL